MFFEKNKKMLMAAGGVAILWIILYFTLVSPNWKDAEEKKAQANQNRETWEKTTKDPKKEKEIKDRNNTYIVLADAREELTDAGNKTERKLKEMRQIEFGTRDSLRSFSTAAAGKNGDVNELLKRKLVETVARVKNVLKSDITQDELSNRFNDGTATVALNLFRLAMVDRFLTACKEVTDENTRECKIERIVKIDYSMPSVINPPEAAKEEKSDDEPDNSKIGARKKPKKDEPEEKTDALDPLIQIPMKILVRVSGENYGNELLFNLQKPTPASQDGEEQRAYFCVRGFHVTTPPNTSTTMELCVGVSALIRKSEALALGLPLSREEAAKKGTDKSFDY